MKTKDKDKDKDKVLIENGYFYDKVDGEALGSHFAHMLANFSMGHYKELWLKYHTGPKVPYYRKKIYNEKVKEKKKRVTKRGEGNGTKNFPLRGKK